MTIRPLFGPSSLKSRKISRLVFVTAASRQARLGP